MHYKIGICDDNQMDADYVASMVNRWAADAGVSVDLQVYPSAEAFLFQYEEEKDFDILLLDIEMGQLNGMDLARKIREENGAVQLVFITGYPDYMAQGYDVTALHYLMKPVSCEKLKEILDRAAGLLAKQPRSIVFSLGKESLHLFAEDIAYGEAQGHYIVLYTKSGEYKIRMTIAELTDKLGEGFYKCSRSFVVGLKYVRRITKTAVVVETDGMAQVRNSSSRSGCRECGEISRKEIIELPLGKGLYDDMNRALIQFLRGR